MSIRSRAYSDDERLRRKPFTNDQRAWLTALLGGLLSLFSFIVIETTVVGNQPHHPAQVDPAEVACIQNHGSWTYHSVEGSAKGECKFP